MDRPPVWRWLRSLPHVTLAFHRGGPRGWTHHETQTITLREGMNARERRDTLLHELLHLDRGPTTAGLRGKDEEQVRRATARYQLPDVAALADALAWAYTAEEAAEELGVSTLVLKKRLKHLHPGERGQLLRRLAHLDEGGC